MAPPSLLPLRVLNACTREEFGAAVHLLFEPVPVLVDHVGNNEVCRHGFDRSIMLELLYSAMLDCDAITRFT